MISKLILCYELRLEDLRQSIEFLKNTLKPNEIVCLKPDDIQAKVTNDNFVYTFHLNLNNEINTHAYVSRIFNQLNLIQLNPFFTDKNIFDNKFLFSKFALANSIPHPKTQLLQKVTSDFDQNFIVKPCCGTEKRDFSDFSTAAVEKILTYDDVIVQPKILIKQEFKILHLSGVFYSDSILDPNLVKEIHIFDMKLDSFFKLNGLSKPNIYSIDIVEDIYSNIFFLEINLRPGALYRFNYILEQQ